MQKKCFVYQKKMGRRRGVRAARSHKYISEMETKLCRTIIRRTMHKEKKNYPLKKWFLSDSLCHFRGAVWHADANSNNNNSGNSPKRDRHSTEVRAAALTWPWLRFKRDISDLQQIRKRVAKKWYIIWIVTSILCVRHIQCHCICRARTSCSPIRLFFSL